MLTSPVSLFLTGLTGADIKDAPLYARPADLSVSLVGRHGDSSSAGIPLRAAADHTCKDAAAAPPLHLERAAECESHLAVPDIILTHARTSHC